MRVLVTGGSGYLGYDVVRRLAERGDQVIAFDNAIRPDLMALAKQQQRVHPVAGDMTDLAHLVDLFQKHRPDAVIHLAAIVGVPASLGSPSNVLRVNVQGSINLFEAMRLCGTRRVLHLSTEEVYGDFVSDEATEDHPANPTTPYGICKLAVEHFGRSYGAVHGLECINLRTSWVYGVRVDRPRPPMNYLNAALEGRPLHLANGAQMVTDYTYVDDLLQGVLLALDHQSHEFDVYNLAAGEATEEARLVALISRLLPDSNLSVGPGFREFAPGVPIPRKGALNCGRAAKAFGYRPKYSLEKGLRAYIDAWRSARTTEKAMDRIEQ